MIVSTIEQVEYSNSADGAIVHIFGRDKTGTPTKIDITGFKPYFYIPSKQASSLAAHDARVSIDYKTEYNSIHGEKMHRAYTKLPSDVRDVREKYSHAEADVVFTTRFMIDNRLTSGVEVPSATCDYREMKPCHVESDARICILDIECDDSRGFPTSERDPIICVTCWDSFDRNYTVFLLKPPSGAPLDTTGINASVTTYENEKDLLRGLVEHISRTNPDVLTGWNFILFDMPYITGRIAALGMTKGVSMARLPGQSDRTALRGRVLFDLLEAYKKLQGTRKESYRLDAVAFDEVGERKVRFSGTLVSLWNNDPRKLVDYNLKDVELCVAINEKSNIIGFYREIAHYIGCPMDKTLNSSSVVDVYVLRAAHGKYVLPSKGSSAGEDFEGATVFEPSTGVKENVVVLDLKALYPMAMLTINASPETKDPNGEISAPNGVRFRKNPDGFARGIIFDLLKERDNKKALRNKHPFDSREYKMYDMQQSVIKVIMNTYYGVSGYSRFRLYDREIGSAVTSVGRAILEHNRKIIEDLGFRVILGDTDSCAFEIPFTTDRKRTIFVAKQIEKILNDSYPVFAKTELNADTQFFSIKFEKIYAKFFQSGKKKRYAGNIVWKEGKDVDEIDVVGFEIRRSDSPKVTKDAMKRVLELILRGSGYDEVHAFLSDTIRKYRRGEYSLDDIGIPGGIGKDLDDYENADSQVRGCLYANQHLGAKFGKGSKPKRVYIKSTGGYPKTDVVCFEYGDDLPADFAVDREVMIQKTLEKPISRIIEALGWNWGDFDPQTPSLARWGI